MTTDAESNLMTLKEQLEQGQYTVDTKKVADAILRSPLWSMLLPVALPSADCTDQKLCS
jgi:hypothetical protein